MVLALFAGLVRLVAAGPEPARLQAIALVPSSAPWHALASLDGAGATLGRRVTLWRDTVRPLRTLDDLRQVPGIGSHRLHAWSDALAPHRSGSVVR